MPLIKSGSRENISANIREMIRSGHSRKQSVAAALSTARRYGKAEGGKVPKKAKKPTPVDHMRDRLRELEREEIEREARLRKDHENYFRGFQSMGKNSNPDALNDQPSSENMEVRDMLDAKDVPFYRNIKSVSGSYPPVHPELQGSKIQSDLGYDDMGKFSAGGYTQGSPWEERAAARSITHAGMIKSNVPGRTDKLPITVGGGAYILPADHLAALGQGNSQAGAAMLNGMFGLGGSKKGSVVKAMRPTIPKLKKMAVGGEPDTSNPTDIIAAGGEYALPPNVVKAIGGGDHEKGCGILDAWVLKTRKQHIKTLKGLRPPKK